jgi:hypothetical protein
MWEKTVFIIVCPGGYNVYVYMSCVCLLYVCFMSLSYMYSRFKNSLKLMSFVYFYIELKKRQQIAAPHGGLLISFLKSLHLTGGPMFDGIHFLVKVKRVFSIRYKNIQMT